MSNEKTAMLCTALIWTAGCGAIAYACKITKSGGPLLAMIFLPIMRYKTSNKPKENVKVNNDISEKGG